MFYKILAVIAWCIGLYIIHTFYDWRLAGAVWLMVIANNLSQLKK